MIDRLLILGIRFLLSLRYRVMARGLRKIARRGTGGILFLPNHPALTDPIIMLTLLHRRFRPWALADREQIGRFGVRRIARRLGARPIPDMARDGRGAGREVRARLTEAIEGLRRGENLLLYPAGRLCRSRLEDLGSKSAVETILREVPSVRVVLVRTRGLWGSGFSYADGRVPNVPRVLRRSLLGLLASGLLFVPCRKVAIRFVEPDDFPRDADRTTINRYLEAFYNVDPPHNTYVPYSVWERPGPRRRSEPPAVRFSRAASEDVPADIRMQVTDYLRDMAGTVAPGDEDSLERDLGLDSIARADLATWLEEEFGFRPPSPDALQTVGDVMLAACGEPVGGPPEPIVAPKKWFHAKEPRRRLTPPDGRTITEAFLSAAKRNPGRTIIADVVSGARTYRDMVMRVMLLKREIEKIPGPYVGIMLPASVAADVVYMATLFAGKTPVMLNWTTGVRNMVHALESLDIPAVLTARRLARRLESRGRDISIIRERLVHLEDMAGRLPLRRKLRAFAMSWANWSSLRRTAPPETAVILFTSGSENLPKAVPLTHENILNNITATLSVLELRRGDSLLDMLPPFHSMGLTIGIVLPLTITMPVAHSPNPNDTTALAAVAEAYQTTVVAGTPTFLAGIARSAGPGQLMSMRLAVAGAEACPSAVYETLGQACPAAVLIEGYGVTECSPIIAVNNPQHPVAGTIGRVIPTFDYFIADPETSEPVPSGQTGMLLVSGPSVFGGYLDYGGPSPFVERDGRRWYRTGDLVSEGAGGLLTFRGRLKRFIKIGGEMISLPAIEAVLAMAFPAESPGEPAVAVEAVGPEHRPEIVLVTTHVLSRAEANTKLREAGLSPLHNVRRVVTVGEIPTLGTGKTDHLAVKKLLTEGA